MEDLKRALTEELIHVTEVFFDEEGNWFIHKTKECVESKLRQEILKEKRTVKHTTKEPI